MMDADLITFLKRSRAALRDGDAIGVKENVCKDIEDGVPDKRFHRVGPSITWYFLLSRCYVLACRVDFGLKDDDQCLSVHFDGENGRREE